VWYKAIDTVNSKDVEHPLSEGCTAQLIYTREGSMNVMVQAENIPPYQKHWLQGTPKEQARAAKGTIAYAGAFRVSDDPGEHRKVFHDVQIGIPPNLRGTLARLAEITYEMGQLILFLGSALN
jgi:hypothetical protein